MNNFTVAAEIAQAPQIRYTSDNQTPLAEMQVQIAGLRPEDAPETLKAVAWGNLAQEIQEKYQEGDRVIIEGRLSMTTVERPEGFKEKRAELTINRIHCIESSAAPVVAPVAPVALPVPYPATPTSSVAPDKAPAADTAPAPAPTKKKTPAAKTDRTLVGASRGKKSAAPVVEQVSEDEILF